MEMLTTFTGRLHPLLVHLPIGILFLAFLFECLSATDRYAKLRKAVRPALLWGFLFATAAAISGYFLRQEGGYNEALADRHQNAGIATAVLALVAYVLRAKVKYWVDPPRRKAVKIALLFPVMVALVLAGHWGGSLTHGEEYLFAAITMATAPPVDPAVKIRTIEDIDQAVLYAEVIQPVLEARCYDCHSARRQKGDLRLDEVAHILRGGAGGTVLVDGPADSSELFRRVMLPITDDDHMPPGERPQLTSSEVALIRYWLAGKPSFEKPVSAYMERDRIAGIIRALQEAPAESWLPAEEAAAASPTTLAAIRKAGIKVTAVAAESPWLEASFSGSRAVTDEHLRQLQQIRDQLVWLNLSHTRITNAQLEPLTRLTNLRVLYLNGTPVDDEGVKKLSALQQLRRLNLAGTAVTDSAVTSLQQLVHLNRLYVFNTAFTAEGVAQLHGHNNRLAIDTGNYSLPVLASDSIVHTRPR